MKTKILSLDNKAAGDVELSDAIFGLEPRADLIQRVVVWQLAKRRSGQHKVLTRAEINRTKKKMYKQKGTGQARHGSIRAPIFVGGGKAHPPRPRDWSYEPPRRVRALALTAALSKFGKEGRLLVVDRFELGEVKTKKLVEALDTLKADRKTLVVDSTDNENLRLSIRNCTEHQFLPPEGLNVYDLLRHDTLILSKEAAKALEARCLKQSASRASRSNGGA